MFISNMKRCDDICSIVEVEQHPQHDYITNWYKERNFMNSIVSLYNRLPPTTNASGQSFCGWSQTNVHSMVPYDADNNDDDYNGPPEYDYWRPGTDPDFCPTNL